MGVMQTDHWMEEGMENASVVFKNLKPYFSGLSIKEIQGLLSSHGMYQPGKELAQTIKDLTEKKRLWKAVQRKYEELKKEWRGPDIPIFLFLSNSHNRRLQHEYNGRSGIAFDDKLFLFLSPDTMLKEVLAVLTHEYHHVCRIQQLKIKEENTTLLDSIMMEGLAEYAVKEYCGDEYLAPWTKYYSKEKAKSHWDSLLKPHETLRRTERKHDDLLLGRKWYPNMLGYNTGFHIAVNCGTQPAMTTKKMLTMTAEEILSCSSFS
ncbi:DUF2268 domain-containing protein [Priestia koreensis]|uniref:DUF2268 domain-containing protein n=1 Tax=Priestia koreensis TaxID=284581 RepID=UPI0034591F5E